MLASDKRKWVITGLLLLLLEWTWVLLGRPHPSTSSIPDVPSPFAAKPSPPAFSTTNDIFDFPSVDSQAIRDVCAATDWNPSLTFTCASSVGGVGNLKNSILICVRYAISAGASLVLPQVIVRSSSDISKIRTGERTGIDYLFDVPHFVASLHLSCPNLTIYQTEKDVPNPSPKVLELQPEDLQRPFFRTGMPRPESWRRDFYAWLARETAGNSPSSTTQIVALNRSYLVYPIHSDPDAFSQTFGSLIKFRPDARRLATAVFRNLVSQHGLAWNGEDTVLHGYLGAHLRTEKDAREGWPGQDWKWSNYETQSQAYLNQSLSSGLKLIYVASGDLSETTRLATDAAAYNITVTTKHTLLSPTDLAELEKMAWDQQGLVDFLVMLKASDFAGVAHSSFAWAVALKRHQGARRGGKAYLEGPQMLSDEFSQVYGEVGGYPEYAATLWP